MDFWKRFWVVWFGCTALSVQVMNVYLNHINAHTIAIAMGITDKRKELENFFYFQSDLLI